MGNTASSNQQPDLDKAIIMNQSKLIQNTSINLSKESIEHCQNKNLFDSFKMELY